jgi:HAD superfamily hydrolase (TIGR01662 family)
MNKALFLDLDGTVIRTRSGDKFPRNYGDWEFMPGILTKIRHYYGDGYDIILISNQGGIEQGYITSEGFQEKIEEVKNGISDHIEGAVSYVYCPFISDANYYRKPNPGMVYQIALQLELCLKHCVMVGDTDSVDGKLAKNAGIGLYYNVVDFIAIIDRI